jgi:hypothetical protein
MTAHDIHKLWVAAAKQCSRDAVDFADLSQSEREVWAAFALLLRDAFRPLTPQPSETTKVS